MKHAGRCKRILVDGPGNRCIHEAPLNLTQTHSHHDTHRLPCLHTPDVKPSTPRPRLRKASRNSFTPNPTVPQSLEQDFRSLSQTYWKSNRLKIGEAHHSSISRAMIHRCTLRARPLGLCTSVPTSQKKPLESDCEVWYFHVFMGRVRRA